MGDQHGDWAYEENTKAISRLGYVPPEVRGNGPADFDADRVSAEDRVRFRARRRAKKTSPLVKTLVIVGVVLVVGLVGTGVWWLSSGEETADDSGLAYEALEQPCAPLDTSVMSDLSGDVQPLAEESDTIGSKTEQVCAVRIGTEPGTGADVEVSTVVFTRDAGARNEFEHVAGKAEEADPDTFATLDGIGEAAFVVSRPWSEDTGTADYSLHLYDGNAYLYARIVVYSEMSETEIADRAAAVARGYLDNWRG
ncbi:hypothetical protein LX16_5125 [Stackebrandtia albiflava]|uniref:Uncharacterized protein n=1 Tax=Stackebrandtia albiflava TaxID=406432 RepID=A0A562UPU6_9ACTN|nr:hypothetical protein [Stackebrandtia albiflava]TWJ07639.1 hypothetical protein LX16_5125 [Stackebrandtia albiflava]